MAVREDCRHYSSRTTGPGEVVQRCRLGANQEAPFACPDDCVFLEPRSVSETGLAARRPRRAGRRSAPVTASPRGLSVRSPT